MNLSIETIIDHTFKCSSWLKTVLKVCSFSIKKINEGTFLDCCKLINTYFPSTIMKCELIKILCIEKHYISNNTRKKIKKDAFF